MSLSTAMNSAMSGLAAASRASLIVSENIANAMTPGYGRRSLSVGAQSHGPGVRVLGVQRHADPALIADRRASDAQLATAELGAKALSRLENLIGSADSESSLSKRFSQFETSLISAASSPSSQVRLDEAARHASDLVKSLNQASEGVQKIRTDADRGIADLVDRSNTLLSGVKDLNTQIQRMAGNSGQVAPLMDQRQTLLDELNQIIPVNVMARSNGQISLYAQGGAVLLDGSAAPLSFDRATAIEPGVSVANGQLSGLSSDGRDVSVSSIAGGALAAQFEIRDQIAVSYQEDLDQIALDLATRFESSDTDPTLSPGDTGMFTDRGAAVTAADVTGLSARLTLNPSLDPDGAAETWRLRDGLGALAPSENGAAAQLNRFLDALEAPSPVSGRDGSAFAGFQNLTTKAAAQHLAADQAQSFAVASQTELARLELEQGVDTDEELQRMIIVEQAYAANARLIQTVDDMMQSLLRI